MQDLRESATSTEDDGAQEFVEAWWRMANDKAVGSVKHCMNVKPADGGGLAALLEVQKIALPKDIVPNPRDRTLYEREHVLQWLGVLKDRVFVVDGVEVSITRAERNSLGTRYQIGLAKCDDGSQADEASEDE